MDNIPDHLQSELENSERHDVCTICGEAHHVEDCKIYYNPDEIEVNDTAVQVEVGDIRNTNYNMLEE